MIGPDTLASAKGVLPKRKQDHCTLVLMESGKMTVRRIYGITTQAANGSLFYSEGLELPLGIVVETGHRQDDQHFIQVIARPNQLHALDWLFPTSWVGLRAVVIFLFGMFAMHLLRTATHAVEIEQSRYGSHP